MFNFIKKKSFNGAKIVLFLFCMQTNVSCSQSFKTKKIPKNYSNHIINDITKTSELDTLIKNAYQLESSLPENYDKTGTKDYTVSIQKALDENRIVVFPRFPLLVNPNGLSLKSNSRIIFTKGSRLLMEANSKQSYEILRLHNVSNVTIYSPTLIGERNMHTGTTGEWGFGISIRGSQKIKILNAVIKNCWGDGIYIGTTGPLTNSDIIIKDSFLDNNRRNGISIVSGINITISNSLISNTNGTAPMSGIDLEPNNNTEFLQNIALKNITTFNNKNEGILIVLRSLYGKNDKEVTVAIENHIDDSSGSAMGFAFPKLNTDFKNIKGNVAVVNSVWKDNATNLVRFHDDNENFVNVNLVHPKVLNKDNNFSQKKIGELKIKCKKGKDFLLTE